MIVKEVYPLSDLTGKIIGCAMEVHRHLGNGFQEVIYQRISRPEFRKILIPIGTNKYLVGCDSWDLSGIMSNATHTGDATGSTALTVIFRT